MAAIYEAAVRDTSATFDLRAPDEAHWRAALSGPYELLVARDEAGTVAGYAKTGRFRDRAAYDTTVETSVYVAESHRSRGIGHLLYTALLARLAEGPQTMAIAGVTQPNEPSMRLHLAHGFTVVGTFREVGIKFGRAWDVTFLQRPV